MLVDLAHPTLHVVGRLVVCHIKDYNDDVVRPASVEHAPRDLERNRVVQHCRNLVGLVAGCRRVPFTAADEFCWAILLSRFLTRRT